MSTIKHAIIGAAGVGSRLGLNIPKCLVTVGGKKIVDYQLELLRDVEDVRIVVGFMENEVIDYVKQVRKDIIFVRNPDYNKTATLQSFFLAARYIQEPFLVIDGDILLEKESFLRFTSECNETTPIIAVTPKGTEDSVCVRYHIDENGHMLVEGFQRSPSTEYEWTGIAYLTNEHILNKNCYVYEALEKHLPLRASIIKCFEIDTQSDLVRANNFYNGL